MMVNSKPQLFLLHFSGGNSYSFQFIKAFLEETFEFHSLELPGRGRRINEKLLLDKSEACQDYVRQIKGLRNEQPYLIFGHSMGASLGLLVTKRMEQSNDPPRILVTSGNAGPGIEKKKQLYLMDDLRFKEELRMLGGVSDELLANEELFELFAPILRADFEIVEKPSDLEKDLLVSAPIYAVLGDKEENAGKVENWKKFTSGCFDYRILAGDHFFIYEHAQMLAQIITDSYKRSLVYEY